MRKLRPARVFEYTVVIRCKPRPRTTRARVRARASRSQARLLCVREVRAYVAACTGLPVRVRGVCEGVGLVC